MTGFKSQQQRHPNLILAVILFKYTYSNTENICASVTNFGTGRTWESLKQKYYWKTSSLIIALYALLLICMHTKSYKRYHYEACTAGVLYFSCGPHRTEDSLKIDVGGPNDNRGPLYVYVYCSWQRAKQVWSAGRIWPMGHHLRPPDCISKDFDKHTFKLVVSSPPENIVILTILNSWYYSQRNGHICCCQKSIWTQHVMWLHLTAHNWRKWKCRFLTCPCHKIYRVEAVGVSISNYTYKITILVCGILGNFVKNWYFVNICSIKVWI